MSEIVLDVESDVYAIAKADRFNIDIRIVKLVKYYCYSTILGVFRCSTKLRVSI